MLLTDSTGNVKVLTRDWSGLFTDLIASAEHHVVVCAPYMSTGGINILRAARRRRCLEEQSRWYLRICRHAQFQRESLSRQPSLRYATVFQVLGLCTSRGFTQRCIPPTELAR